jgi:hypothetical protein
LSENLIPSIHSLLSQRQIHLKVRLLCMMIPSRNVANLSQR